VVQNSGKTLCSDVLKPVNLPETVQVEEAAAGLPGIIRLPHRQAVTAIINRWRIDDEWWRSEPISRLYYTVILKSGQRMTVFKDLVKGSWLRQG
jgi:hypothetical protein